MGIRRIAVIVVALLVALGASQRIAVTAYAQDHATWPVKGKLIGKKGKKSKDLSGIACTAAEGFPRSCLVVDDEVQHAQSVTLEDGKIRAGDIVPLIDNKHDDNRLELDGEGIAYADGFYYVIGSHGHPRDEEHKLDPVTDAELIRERIGAASQIVRVKVSPSGAVSAVEPSAGLRDIIGAQVALKKFIDRRLESNGLTVEGIALRGGRIFVGFRGPTLEDGHAAILSVALDGVFGTGAADARLHLLRLGEGRGVRDLAPFKDGLLILAGPAADNPGAYAICAWDGKGDSVRLLKGLSDIVGDDPDRKPEALLALDGSGADLRVLVLFDGQEKGAPTAIRIPAP